MKYDNDIINAMIKNRIIFLNEEIDNKVANNVILQLLYLDSLNNEDIKLYINSPGGDITQGLAIIDCINSLKNDVQTICVGCAYSMAAIILICGKKGKRKILPNSEIMIHSVLGRAEGNLTKVMLSSMRLQEKSRLIHSLIKEKTNLKNSKISTMMKTDSFLNSSESLKYGFVDKIVTCK